MIQEVWKNKKNGELYIVLHNAVDCTNERDGKHAIVYVRFPVVDAQADVYVRDEEEFVAKFSKMLISPPVNIDVNMRQF